MKASGRPGDVLGRPGDVLGRPGVGASLSRLVIRSRRVTLGSGHQNNVTLSAKKQPHSPLNKAAFPRGWGHKQFPAFKRGGESNN